MFGLPIFQVSSHIRPTPGEGLGEVIATFGLVLVILLALRYRIEAIPMAVAAFITSAYWFTSSTSFANPAVTFARDDRHLCRNLTTQRTAFCRWPVGRRSVGYLVCALAARCKTELMKRKVSRVNRASPVNKKVNISAMV